MKGLLNFLKEKSMPFWKAASNLDSSSALTAGGSSKKK